MRQINGTNRKIANAISVDSPVKDVSECASDKTLILNKNPRHEELKREEDEVDEDEQSDQQSAGRSSIIMSSEIRNEDSDDPSYITDLQKMKKKKE